TNEAVRKYRRNYMPLLNEARSHATEKIPRIKEFIFQTLRLFDCSTVCLLVDETNVFDNEMTLFCH
ncbi:hypothetical protein, partial [Marinifilum sp. D737]|uniref:hypothetical protein n=1 Tax=Marinifilum sp. D737 TaxID=2969628 RepID=UPI0022725059